MNEVKIFENEDFGTVRTVVQEEKVYFCASDVAKCLGYKRPNDAINQHCKGCTVKCSIPHPQSQGKTIEMSFITEGDVYRLIAHSKLESAQKFESWVFDEVLPILRKTGSYTVQPLTMEDCMKIIAQSSAQISSAISALSVQTQTNTAQLQDNTSRIEKLEKKFEEHKLDIPPEMPVKDYVISIVRDISNKTKTPFQDIYRKLYSDYGLITHTNPSAKAKNRNMTTIVFIEKEGDINLLAQLAHKLLQNSSEDKE